MAVRPCFILEKVGMAPYLNASLGKPQLSAAGRSSDVAIARGTPCRTRRFCCLTDPAVSTLDPQWWAGACRHGDAFL